MLQHLFMKLERRDALSGAERSALEAAGTEVVSYAARKVIVRDNVELNTSNLLIDGVVCRYKDLPNGQRQILELHVPGDFIDLHSFLLKRLDHNIAALSPVQVRLFPHDGLKTITEEHPHLARMLWFSTLLDAAGHREWILSVGRRAAVGRLAHLFCELLVRLEVVGLADETGYDLPLTQMDLADATGLTPVHVNRMLRELRDGGVLSFREGRVTIHDAARLRRVAQFDPAYLYLERRER